MAKPNQVKPNYISGKWVTANETAQNINPSDVSEVIGEYSRGSVEQIDQAIESAAEAQKTWKLSTPQVRADALDFIGTELLARRDELGRLLSREEGKTLAEGIGEVTRAGQVFKYYAQEALRVVGDHLASLRPGITVDVKYEPVGVVGLITPWNFPIAIPAWKAAPALAYGNCVILKPAELTPGVAWEMTEIISRSGLPAGVFNLVMGPGSVVGAALAESDQVNAISFTGSVGTGARIRETVTGRGGRIQLEMGGKSPLIVLDDADLVNAVDCAINGSVISTGQRCTSNTRIIATAGIYDRLLEKMGKLAKTLKVGHALDPDTQIGPVVDASQMKVNLDIARNEGAEIICGGEEVTSEHIGFYMSPAVVGNCNNAMKHVREEIFGPVVSVLEAESYEAALAIANDSDLALSSGICTTSLRYAEHFKTHSHSGMVQGNRMSFTASGFQAGSGCSSLPFSGFP